MTWKKLRYGVLGTGVVGHSIASKLVGFGSEVMMGSRTKDNAKAVEWASANGPNASHGTFMDAARFGETIVLCVKGDAALDALKMAGEGNFKGKTVIDITNPLDFSRGMPPSLLVCNTDSLGEHVQKALAGANVVKTLNIVNAEVMAEPKKTGGDPTMYICGDSPEAKDEARSLLESFGWKDILDLGDITSSRGVEMLLPLWVRTYMILGDPHFGFKVVRKG